MAPSETLRKAFITLLGAALLTFLWHRNYNLVGDTYDYSIVTSVSGYLHEGLKPYRDFTTPLQSLTIYMCYVSELIFGRRYLSLAYMNLILGLGFYAILVRLLKNYLPFALGILAATAICAATFFQHGILWYNSLAISLLMLIALCAAIIYRRQAINRPIFLTVCALLYLSSMCKVNFHLLALGMFAGIMAFLFLKATVELRKKFIPALVVFFIFGVVLGPITEVGINRTSFHDFKECVFATPTHRLNRLLGILDPNLILGKISDFLPDNWCSGVYLFGLLIFSSCLYLIVRKPVAVAVGHPVERERWLKYIAPLVFIGFFMGSIVISITNSEIEWLTSSFLMAGLLAAFIMFTPALSPEQILCFKLEIFLLTGFFFVGSSATAFMHARVRAGEDSWTRAMLQTMYKAKKLSALKNAVPFYDAETISPDLTGYFGGTRFTGLQYPRMVKIVDCVNKYQLKKQPEKVYWGSGLQIMSRVYGTAPHGRFPLWYHLKVSVRDKDAPVIIDAFKKNNYEWIICSPWMGEMPLDVRNYITNNYQNIGDDEVIVFHQKK